MMWEGRPPSLKSKAKAWLSWEPPSIFCVVIPTLQKLSNLNNFFSTSTQTANRVFTGPLAHAGPGSTTAVRVQLLYDCTAKNVTFSVIFKASPQP